MNLKTAYEKAKFRYKRQEEIKFNKDYIKKYDSQPKGDLVGRCFNYSRGTGFNVMAEFNKYY